ncbi:hypothetical protein V6N12_039069 [Hibiscus sabdariffa]|uniref:Uncharacterized protein n=1 Tax=Hibiscus sabdariffa TaxID=183260 RepID=A0ABR2DZK2_9ROSI
MIRKAKFQKFSQGQTPKGIAGTYSTSKSCLPALLVREDLIVCQQILSGYLADNAEVTDAMLFALCMLFCVLHLFIRCNWAAKAATSSDDKPGSNAKSTVEPTDGASEEDQEKINDDAPENNCVKFTSMANLNMHISESVKLHLHNLGVGAIEDVHVQRGTNSAPLPPPAAAPMSGLSAALGRYGGAQVMSMTATIFFLAS